MSSERTLPRSEIIAILTKRDGEDCFLCNTPFKEGELPTLDHWIPQSRGGTWDVENLRLAHKRCNALKGDIMPNPDGTLPERVRGQRAADRRNALRSLRSEVCNVCRSGRDLDYGDVCGTCGSGPMPLVFPQWARARVPDCDHDLFWCWMCSIGIIDRKAAIHDVVNSGELDE